MSNAFLIAYTSAWGATFDSEGKLWLVIFFEVRILAAALPKLTIGILQESNNVYHFIHQPGVLPSTLRENFGWLSSLR